MRLEDVFEIPDERAVEAGEDGKFGFVELGYLRVPRPSICSQRMSDCSGRRNTMSSNAVMSTPEQSMSTLAAFKAQ